MNQECSVEKMPEGGCDASSQSKFPAISGDGGVAATAANHLFYRANQEQRCYGFGAR
jgi:hypothetical protein